MSDGHKTVPIQVWADIDVGIAPLVRRLNEMEGVRTHASCEGTSAGPYVMVSWHTPKALGLIQAEFHLKIEGESWGYAHPDPVKRMWDSPANPSSEHEK